MANTPVASPSGFFPDRGRARGRGYIDRITILPLGSAPRFTATVSVSGKKDGGESVSRGRSVRLVWIGQRRVPGIEAGAQLAFDGMVSLVDGIPTIHNPRYEIIGRPEAKT